MTLIEVWVVARLKTQMNEHATVHMWLLQSMGQYTSWQRCNAAIACKCWRKYIVARQQKCPVLLYTFIEENHDSNHRQDLPTHHIQEA